MEFAGHGRDVLDGRAPDETVADDHRSFVNRHGRVEAYFSLFDNEAIVVTAESGSEQGGCLVGFFTRCSIHPPRLLVGISVVNHTFRVASAARTLGVHVLDRSQRDLASLFGEQTGDRGDKLREVAWHRGRLGTPILDGCAAWLEGLVADQLPLGDHTGFVLEAVDAGVVDRATPLRLSEIGELTAGHLPDEVITPEGRRRSTAD
jgi:flavin reductase (DIM6/NTAB) family NADH-FMN oxidoreductase RutF